MDGPDKYARDLEDRIKSRVYMYERMKNRERYAGLIPGAIILAIGAIFLLDNLGVVNARHFWQFWPLCLLFAGLVKLTDPSRRFGGMILLSVGALLQLNEFGIIHFSWGTLWPLVLMAAGAMAMWSALRARRMMEGKNAENADPRRTLNESAIFGGVEKRLNTKEFRGGQLQSLFGGIEIDLRDADIAESEAVLNASAIFGGIEIRVPETWYVAARGQGIFGGYSDSTRYVSSGDSDKPKKTLLVVGTAIFGGVEIRN